MTQKIGATTTNGFQILLLHPKNSCIKKYNIFFWGRSFDKVLPTIILFGQDYKICVRRTIFLLL